ncbi:MAG TPA: PAS domain S-box protein, partial [Acidimicrobiia bacterium]|nr:PAS domain S-box protein [Acidimicrobiia bacterium]
MTTGVAFYRRVRLITGGLALVGFGIVAGFEPMAWPLVAAAAVFLLVSAVEMSGVFSDSTTVVVLDALVIFGVVYVVRPFPGAEAVALALVAGSAIVFARTGLLRPLLPAITAIAAVEGVANWVMREPVAWSNRAMVGNAVVSALAVSPVLYWMAGSIGRALPTGTLISSVVPDTEAFANIVTERSAEGIALIDFGSTIRYANPAFARMFGYEPDEIIGRSMSLMMDADTYARHDAAVQRSLSSKHRIETENMELVGRHRDGRPVTVWVSLSELTGGGERLVLGSVRDVSETVRLRDRLEESLAAKDEFVATVSHELRTPLTAVVAFSEMLRDRAELDASEQEEFIGLIADQAREVAYLIEDLLVASRLDTDSMTVSVRPMSALLEVRSVSGAWAMHRSVHVDETSVDHTVLADPGRFRQILRNLVVNAVKYGGEEITVSAVVGSDGPYHLIVR